MPAPRLRNGVTRTAISSLLICSALAIFSAPLAMPAGYSWVSNVISESAAQGLEYAWIARSGFLLFGFAVLWLASRRREAWSFMSYASHMAFGVLMVSTAAFSHKPFIENAPFDQVEDLLHSVTATGMGFAFAIGVAPRAFQRGRNALIRLGLDGLAVLASVALPLTGSFMPEIAGVVQRLMFVIAYLWYGAEVATPNPESKTELLISPDTSQSL